ncbi:lysophospholipid acyltransferase family protein [Salinifilum aidingensis]
MTVHNRCRPACLPPDDAPPRVGVAHRSLRQVAVAVSHLVAIAFGWASRWSSERSARRLLQLWSRCLLRAAGISVRIDGAPEHPGAKLVTSNHVSAFDGMAMLARFGHFVLVADSGSADNPVFGRLSRASGAVFLEGGGSGLVTMVRSVAGALRSGESVLVCPEGEIRCREPGGPFPPAVLQAALDADVAVQPVLLRCVLADGTPTARATFFAQDESPAAMLRRVLRMRGLHLHITLLPPLDPGTARNRRDLAVLAKRPIDELAGPLPDSCAAPAPAEQPQR